MTFWMLHEFIQSAYDLGFNSKESDVNPFEFESNEWYCWNRGKNTKLFNELI
jgi:hypothetical protein